LEIAQNYEMSLAQLCLTSVNSRPYIDCNIIGATSLDQLKENLGSKNIRLSPQIVEEIDEVHAEISNTAA
jgi:aryl-alcohol dehydrogenase-like predicted oxidoreductase